MLLIDGSEGEGGGQILRTSLALSLVTLKPFRMVNVRAKRKKPGLLRQHLTAIQAAATVSRAKVEGDQLGSATLSFTPGEVSPGRYHFSVGTAGSATLVLQAILPPLLLAPESSTITVEGGTHNPMAPPFDFLERVFVPVVNRLGPRVSVELARHGFYPAGGGRFQTTVEPAPALAPLELFERGEIRGKRATVVFSGLPEHIAEREHAVLAKKLNLDRPACRIEPVDESRGPGNVVLVEIESEHVTELFTGFGERGRRAEAVADHAIDEARRYLAAGVPVGSYLADQLVIPLALAGTGGFRTLSPSGHLRTNVGVVERFLDVAFSLEQESRDVFRVTVRPR